MSILNYKISQEIQIIIFSECLHFSFEGSHSFPNLFSFDCISIIFHILYTNI